MIMKKTKKKIKALCLMSGGLDSALAAKLVAGQGIQVTGICFTSPFFSNNGKHAEKICKQIGIPLIIIELGDKYFEMLRKPKHGYGSALNPCTDCHIFMLKEAKKLAKKLGAKFIFTGEVLGQRPMSQQLEQLNLIEKEAGLKGKLLRPLSAKLLVRTEAEKKGWVDVSQFPDISGRSRNEQFALAKQFRIRGFSSPSGGCLLTCHEFAAKVRDLFEHKENISAADIELLKTGRHFRIGKSKIIVGKNFEENQKLMKMKSAEDWFFEAEDKIPSPITLLQGQKGKAAVEKACQLTGYYSDARGKKVKINYGKEKLDKFMKPKPISEADVIELRIMWKKP